MAYKTGAKGNGRNFGLNGGPGKGSADRTTDRKAYLEGLSKVKFPANNSVGFVKRGTKLIKKYS